MSDFLRPNDEVVSAYRSLRSRIIEMIRSTSEPEGDRPVPHCPAWRVRDLVAHLVGAPEDIIAGRLEGVASDAWTQAQVDRHARDSMRSLADSWEATVAEFDVILPLIPAPVNSQLILDTVTHEHDLCHALGLSGRRDGLALSVAVGWVLHMAERGSPGRASELRTSGLDDFDLLRVCTGRRSREQIEALGVDPALIEQLTRGTPVSIPPQTIDE